MIKLITHTDLDGTTCAILAKYVYEDNIDITFVDYNKVNEYMEKLEPLEYEAVYMTDISCDEKYINKITQLIDHHKTALYLNKYNNCSVKINDDDGFLLSASLLFKKYLEKKYKLKFPWNIAKCVTFTDFYDTWKWKSCQMQEANDLNTLFWSLGIEEFINHIFTCDTIFNEVASAIIKCENRKQCKYINEKLKNVTKIDIDGKIYGFVFAEQYFSALGDAMKEHDYDVAVMIDISDNTISFRSNDKVDVSEIAINLNGGGHKNASGARPYWIKDIKDEIINSMIRMIEITYK